MMTAADARQPRIPFSSDSPARVDFPAPVAHCHCCLCLRRGYDNSLSLGEIAMGSASVAEPQLLHVSSTVSHLTARNGNYGPPDERLTRPKREGELCRPDLGTASAC